MAYDKKKQKIKPIKVILLLVVFLPFVLTIIATTIGRKEFTLPHRLGFEVVGTAQSGINETVGFFDDIWSHYLYLVGVSKENDRLREDINKHKAINAKYREAAATNIRLSKLLDLENSLGVPAVTATIVSRDPSLWFKTLTINKGSISGIIKGMPAVTLEGVVGQVTNVSPHFAKILLATDPNSAIDAIIQKNRVQGIIKGEGNGYGLHYVLKNNVINKDDHIITSGMGGVFPKALPIGKVSELIKSKRGMFLKIKVQPLVDFRKLEYVTIILKTDSLTD